MIETVPGLAWHRFLMRADHMRPSYAMTLEKGIAPERGMTGEHGMTLERRRHPI
jgi:hypothetical protein